MKKPLHKKGDRLMVKPESNLFYEIQWLNTHLPFVKVYSVEKVIVKNEVLGNIYFIGSVNKFDYDYWDTCTFLDYHDLILHNNYIVQDHFYTIQESRKMKLDNL